MGREKGCLSEVWGEIKSWDQHLSEFRAMKRQKDETISMFNRRFHIFYHKMPKEIQPFEASTRLCYATTFHPDLSFLLMERQYVTLQQIFFDAQEIEDNL